MTERFDQEPDQETPIPVPTHEEDHRQYQKSDDEPELEKQDQGR